MHSRHKNMNNMHNPHNNSEKPADIKVYPITVNGKQAYGVQHVHQGKYRVAIFCVEVEAQSFAGDLAQGKAQLPSGIQFSAQKTARSLLERRA